MKNIAPAPTSTSTLSFRMGEGVEFGGLDPNVRYACGVSRDLHYFCHKVEEGCFGTLGEDLQRFWDEDHPVEWYVYFRGEEVKVAEVHDVDWLIRYEFGGGGQPPELLVVCDSAEEAAEMAFVLQEKVVRICLEEQIKYNQVYVDSLKESCRLWPEDKKSSAKLAEIRGKIASMEGQLAALSA